MATPPDDVSGYQLAVLDIALDPMLARNREGLELIQHVTAQGTPCVVLSGLEDEDLVTQIKQLPNVLDFIPKTSFRRDVFITLVRQSARRPSPTAQHLLIVEDDARWRDIYEDVLSDEGYVLHSAISYGEARGWLQREEIALAIVDLHLISSAPRRRTIATASGSCAPRINAASPPSSSARWARPMMSIAPTKNSTSSPSSKKKASIGASSAA